jgi:flavin reductase (DIM6/NTAB) family NADH-FMN oxidoreductase RutF
LHSDSTGTPVMNKTPAFGECRLLTTVEQGEYSNFIGEVEYSGVSQEPEGHADEVTLFLKDLSENKLRPL